MDKELFVLLALIFGPMIFSGCIGCDVGEEVGYEQGQIDALSGSRVMYELRDMPDGSRKWVKREQPATRPAEVSP